MSGIIVDIILFIIIAGNATLCYKRGLTKLIFSLCFSVVSMILVFILYRPVTNYIMNNTQIPTKLENVFIERIDYLFKIDNIENASQIPENSILGAFIDDEMSNLITETTDSLKNYLAFRITYKIINSVVFFVLFAIIRLLLYLLKTYIEFIANLPFIRVINHSGGMIFGVIRGFFIIYVIFAILLILLPIIGDTIIITSIQNAKIGGKMFQNNILLNAIFYFI